MQNDQIEEDAAEQHEANQEQPIIEAEPETRELQTPTAADVADEVQWGISEDRLEQLLWNNLTDDATFQQLAQFYENKIRTNSVSRK